MILIVGVGNILRSDDGIGAFVIQKISELKLPAVELQVTHQLHLESIEKFLDYEKIIVVDAACIGADYDFQKIELTSTDPTLSSSHHLSLQLLLALSKKLYNHDTDLFLCSIKGINFEIGETISPQVHSCVPYVLGLISREVGGI
jgi:hydrogenase maturation protease